MIHVPAMSATTLPPTPLTLEDADLTTAALHGASPQEPWIDSLGRLVFIEDGSNNAVLEHSAASAQRPHPPALDFSLTPDRPKQQSLQQPIPLDQPFLVPRLYWQSPVALWKQAVPEASFLGSTAAPGVATPRSMESCKDRQQNQQQHQVQDQQEEHVSSLLWAKLKGFVNLDGQCCPTRNNHLTKEEAHLRNVWVFMGFFVFMLLALIPLWNASRLLLDPSYVYFAGKVSAHGIISVCIPLPIFYVCSVSLIFKRGSPQARAERMMLNVGTFFLTVFGLSLLLLSLPMWRDSQETSKDLSYHCSTASKTKELFQASQALQRLRFEQACESLHSVVQCPGFQSSAYSDVLQDMERIYQCAGYCVEPVATKPGAAAAVVSFSNLHVQKKKLQGGRHTILHAHSAMRAASTSSYPPTLFSTTNWQASCNGMAANFMRQELGDIANQTFYQGLGLMIMTIAARVLSLL